MKIRGGFVGRFLHPHIAQSAETGDRNQPAAVLHLQSDAPLSAVVTDLARHVGHALDRVLLRDQMLGLAAAMPVTA